MYYVTDNNHTNRRSASAAKLAGKICTRKFLFIAKCTRLRVRSRQWYGWSIRSCHSATTAYSLCPLCTKRVHTINLSIDFLTSKTTTTIGDEPAVEQKRSPLVETLLVLRLRYPGNVLAKIEFFVPLPLPIIAQPTATQLAAWKSNTACQRGALSVSDCFAAPVVLRNGAR